jgi:hypothetical protein
MALALEESRRRYKAKQRKDAKKKYELIVGEQSEASDEKQDAERLLQLLEARINLAGD